jgi:hypothetical protein
MSLSQIQRDIETYFSNNWTETPVYYQNVAYSEASEFIRLTILSGKRFQASLGNTVNTYRTPGVIIVQIFCPKNRGTTRALNISDLIITFLQSKVIGSVNLKTPFISFQNIVDSFYQVNMTCPFYVDNIQ